MPIVGGSTLHLLSYVLLFIVDSVILCLLFVCLLRVVLF